ncbi:PAS domain S-box protein [Desulfococcaceae bacterium HSG9]|nr:PAS domain S-box protein [Desulfococcaceae bacterium HSG9]
MKKNQFHSYRIIGTAIVSGALLLTLLALIQKIYLGLPLELKGFIVPVFFGALAGLIVGSFYSRITHLNSRLTSHIKLLSAKNVALRESEENLKITLNSIGDAVIATDAKGCVIRMNPVAEKLTGWELADARGCQIDKVFVIKDELTRSSLESPFQQVLREKNVIEQAENMLLIAKDGTTHSIADSAAPILNTDGVITGVVIVFQDITEKRKAWKAASSSDKRFRNLIEGSIEGILIHRNFKPILINQAYADIYGYSVDEILAMESVLPLFAAHERSRLSDYYEARIKGENVPSQYECQGVDKDDQLIWLDMRVMPIEWEGVPAVQITVFDISKRKRVEKDKTKLENQFHQAQKFEATSNLAGGIAHDFNNLLMGIQGNASLMLMYTDTAPAFVEKLQNIEHYVQRGTELTQQLLTLSRGDSLEMQTTDLNALITKSAKLFSRTHKEISIHKNMQAELYKADTDQGQIEQVFLNLFVNAAHAMPSGGDLYLETENIYINKESVMSQILSSGHYVRLAITDTGMGMDQETQTKIFDPFFTTKSKGEGTGLGLTSAFGIIKKHGGIINVYSEKGEGTTFNIYLPASGKLETDLVEETDDAPIEGGNETILLVDDEDIVITVGGEMLELLGYTVLTARSGQEAVDIYKADHDRIDLVILDIIMPHKGGEETFEQLKALDPDIVTLLSSGYAINTKAKRILNKGCRGFIQKPFDIRRLAQKIRMILKSA